MYLRIDVLDMFIDNSTSVLITSGIMVTLLKQNKTKPKIFFERIIKRNGFVKCDTTLNLPIHKGKGNGSSKLECTLVGRSV